jgi:copper transport protein
MHFAHALPIDNGAYRTNAPGRSSFAMFPLRRFLATMTALLCAVIVLLGGHAPQAAAHADLVRAEPPIDGLVLAAPAQLHLFFSEDISTADPGPSIRLLDAQGNSHGTSLIPVGANGNPRELIANIGGLGEGIYTVEWSVQSATDGHVLSGVYAFRIGGGIPPGQATTEGERPEAWGVATRWATFLGSAVAAAGFLFGAIVLRNHRPGHRWQRRRARLVIAGLLIALISTVLEPVFLTLFPPVDATLSLPQAVRGLPDAWWWRPLMLIPLLVLAIVVAYPLRARLPQALAWIGGIGSLLTLLGLSLTSHAAGLASGRELGIASDIVHQVSVALWVGGLVHLAAWWPSRKESDSPGEDASGVLRRFSAIALGLFAVATITGVLNAWVIFPALSDLWESDYGIVLIVKVAILLAPFALAAWHWRSIRRAGKTGADALTRLTTSLRRTVRLEAILVLAVVLAASTLALSAPPVDTSADNADEITIAMPAATGHHATTEPEAIAHLTFSPGRQGANEIRFRLTDMEGRPLPSGPAPRVTAEFTSLDHAVTRPDVSLQPVDTATQTYGTEGLELTIDGWWRIRTTIARDGVDDLTAEFYLLLPDPNMNGFDAPPQPDPDPEAEAMLNDAMSTMSAWSSLRWWQALSGGNDSLVISDYAITTTAANGQPDAFTSQTTFSGGFERRADGTAPAPPTRNTYRAVTIGERGWSVDADGTVTEQSATQYLPIDRYPETYEGADHIRFGGTEEVNGEVSRIITFHTPERSGQSEAWFAFWVGTETGNIHRLAMVASNHYMVWEYSAFNEPFVIEAPDGATPSASPAATPVATPVGRRQSLQG